MTRILLRERPERSIALATETHVLILKNTPSGSTGLGRHGASATSLHSQSSGHGASGAGGSPQCVVELLELSRADLSEYRVLSHSVYGTLGLITVENDVFLCVVSGSMRVATVRPGETVEKILSVDFHCLNSAEHDNILNEDINLYPTDGLDEDGFERGGQQGRREPAWEHPCLALKKLLSGGTFYYSVNFDLTSRLQDRAENDSSFNFDDFEKGYLWNSYMIKPLMDFRGRLSERERLILDSTRLLTSAIRGFVFTLNVPSSSAPVTTQASNAASSLTLISRLSCKRAGTRFNARGIDDDGNVANFVETETVFWSPSGPSFSYVQIRGSVPVFWEQSAGLLPGQQKIQIARSHQATQPAFDKHFEELELKYGGVHIVNLLSKEKSSEDELSRRYEGHVKDSSLNNRQSETVDHNLLKQTHYDFHAETRGAAGYEAASMISRYIEESAESFAYCLIDTVENQLDTNEKVEKSRAPRTVMVLQQQGVFRTNCLDCLDRTNLVQTMISQMALQTFLSHRAERGSNDFFARHASLWADNGDALSKIYAGTGALKSSFTRTGKMSLAGALADARKTATRMYINNFADKGRQTTMDMLLGRLLGQTPVYLFDPINDYVNNELKRRAAEYYSTKDITLWVGTLNLNGRSSGIREDLSPWLCPPVTKAQQSPSIVAVGFQEIVELSPQQIMSTEPGRRQSWEKSVEQTLNENARATGSEEYTFLRGNQLVGASLSIFVKQSLLKHVKNVEGSIKKTGMSGMAGNKGAVAVRMEVDNTSLCFVTAHLAAGFANYEERNRDYKTIAHGLRFQRNRSINDHDTVLFFGDFNYRIGLGDEKVRSLCAQKDWERLYANDQLNLQMVAGLTFTHYSEARILFAPTYRYDVGTNDYDTSEKHRIPAWCDRILCNGHNLRQHEYNTAPLYFSDHRPVYATFTCTVNVVDEDIKNALSKEIYSARKTSFKGSTLTGPRNSDAEDEEDLLGYESIEPGLPPASSAKKRWWLDNGLPATSQLAPPSTGLVPNPERLSNPFTPTDKPDWVQRSRAVPALPPSRKPVGSGPPPDTSPITSSGGSRTQSQKPVKPPIPPKPNLGSPGIVSQTAMSPNRNHGSGLPQSSVVANDTPFPPPPRRSTATQQLPSHPKTQGNSLMDDDSDVPPALPQRRNTNANGLMDEDDADKISGWEPLKPS